MEARQNKVASEPEEDRKDERIRNLQNALRDARNELCRKCGEYREAYLGACEGCRWNIEWRKYIDD